MYTLRPFASVFRFGGRTLASVYTDTKAKCAPNMFGSPVRKEEGQPPPPSPVSMRVCPLPLWLLALCGPLYTLSNPALCAPPLWPRLYRVTGVHAGQRSAPWCTRTVLASFGQYPWGRV